ncbi:MAG: Trp family transcriptional regulator [Candidatus Gottesmanbacteria bacterium]|nr:Trp family transcriptional regulator [Candidatus Gottesmanbacteria bacterium]
MTRISKYRLDEDLEREVFSVFWSSLSQLRTASDVSSFFSDLLSKTEEIMLAKRFAVALLLMHGKRPVEIAPILHVSFSTIRSVNEWYSRSTAATKRVLEAISRAQKWQAVFDRMDHLFDELPPRYGTDWHAAGIEKGRRRNERFSHSELR